MQSAEPQFRGDHYRTAITLQELVQKRPPQLLEYKKGWESLGTKVSGDEMKTFAAFFFQHSRVGE